MLFYGTILTIFAPDDKSPKKGRKPLMFKATIPSGQAKKTALEAVPGEIVDTEYEIDSLFGYCLIKARMPRRQESIGVSK